MTIRRGVSIHYETVQQKPESPSVRANHNDLAPANEGCGTRLPTKRNKTVK